MNQKKRNKNVSLKNYLSPKRIGAVYVLIALVAAFSIAQPNAFLSTSTFLIIINGAAISGIVAIGVIVPLAAGVFDVSVGYLISLGSVLVAFLVAYTAASGPLAVIFTLVFGAVATLINVLVVVVLRVPSLIGTLATGLVFLSMVTALSNQQQITQNVKKVSETVGISFGFIGMPVVILIILGGFLWYVMSQTPLGRHWYAIGFDEDTAKLAGINVRKLQTYALVISGLCAVLAGLLITARVGAGSPTTGPDYLLPAFTAAFVGATQFTPGRFNVPGTVLAVIVLGTATVGLSIVGAPVWVSQLLQGSILIAAVALDSIYNANNDGGSKIKFNKLKKIREKK